ncbi:ATP-dependent endonuclease [Pelagicoccus sp. SDUM812005]|uniref:ATP-dependent nuclease n=1 Tax=Pelagicoccus sp. SDUM812005 TaxID=3041257 RepID=UPI00280E425F|nr:ATP-dependent endonuclease [Pelagicoccus sp. SDUM812005]MDQ8179654.1 ATP-dependent endonuclease [Pelagicoccus sp. SDUM812005]
MKLSSVRIQNFRSYSDETIPLDNYTCFVGPNGAGKSNVLSALNLFFQNPTSSLPSVKQLDLEDFHNKNGENPIRITVTFRDLSKEESEELNHYVRQNELIVSTEAVWDTDKNEAKVKQCGSRLGMRAFAERYFSKSSSPAKELKEIFKQLRTEFDGIATATSKVDMEQALRDYEATHRGQCEELQSEDEFYGANSGKLNRFVQWVYVPAVKEAQEEGEESKKSALGQLLARTVRQKTNFGEKLEELKTDTLIAYRKLLNENQSALDDVSRNLQNRLAAWSHQNTTLNLEWLTDSAKSVQVQDPSAGVYTGEGKFSGKLSRMGHGLQRSYLLALLIEVANVESDNQPTLIFACEEPELYQHPPQIRRLSEVFTNLVETNSQVLVTTHSPHFVKGKDFENVRLLHKDLRTGQSKPSYSSSNDISNYLNKHRQHREIYNPSGLRVKINQSLLPHLNEMFFCRFPVFVEGLEDVAFITTALHIFDLWDDFHASGCHLIPTNGKNHLIHPVAIANKLGIPFFLIFDCDSNQIGKNREKQKLDNLILFSLVGHSTVDAFPTDGYLSANCKAWPVNMGKSVEADFSRQDLCKHMQEARRRCGGAGQIAKNSMFISEWLTIASESGHRSPTLENLCKSIIRAATQIQLPA